MFGCLSSFCFLRTPNTSREATEAREHEARERGNLSALQLWSGDAQPARLPTCRRRVFRRATGAFCDALPARLATRTRRVLRRATGASRDVHPARLLTCTQCVQRRAVGTLLRRAKYVHSEPACFDSGFVAVIFSGRATFVLNHKTTPLLPFVASKNKSKIAIDSKAIENDNNQFQISKFESKPGHTSGGSGRGARRGGGAGSGRTGCQQNCSPRRQGSVLPSDKTSLERLPRSTNKRNPM